MRTVLLLSMLATACGGTKPSAPPAGASAPLTVETFAELAVGPGNITVTPDQRVIVSLHQFYAPDQRVVELRDGAPVPFPDPAAYAQAGGPPLDAVLGIAADDRGVVWMLDNAMRGGGARKLVGWHPGEGKLEAVIELAAVTPADAFLNDLAVDRTHGAIYLADPAGGPNAALIVVDLATRTARRVLEGHASVTPGVQDLVIDGVPVEIKQPDGTRVRPHIGVNPIALDATDEWLYFGPMHGDQLFRVPTAALRDATLAADALAARVEPYARRPITDGISLDTAGNLYLGDLANHAIGVIGPDRQYRQLVAGPELAWVDAFSFAPDGYYYVVANQLHLSATLHAGVDATRPPFRILRFRPLAPGRVGR